MTSLNQQYNNKNTFINYIFQSVNTKKNIHTLKSNYIKL